MGVRGRGSQEQTPFGERSRRETPAPGFGRAGVLIGVATVVVVLGGLAWAAALASVPPSEHPRRVGGSLGLEDQRPLTVIDLATGQVTIRLQGVYTDVGAAGYGDVDAVALDSGTLLLDRKTGVFNILAKNDYLMDTAGPGVGLGSLNGSTGAVAYAAGSSAYIVRYAPRSTVSLVDPSTVLQGAALERQAARSVAPSAKAVAPRGFSQLAGPVPDTPGSAVVDRPTGDLWVLVGAGGRCDAVQLHPLASAHLGLVATTRASFPLSCARAAIAAGGGSIAVAWPGNLRLFYAGAGDRGRQLNFVGTSGASALVPVTGSPGRLRFLIRTSSGWSLSSVAVPSGRQARHHLASIPPGADPAPPVMSAGSIYTLDQAANGQPALWEINATTGSVSSVIGEAAYPARGPTEKASFVGAQVLASGPRVVFNNPGSLLAVVVFTDGSRPPRVVDKSEAVTVSATGPADISVTPPAGQGPQPPGPPAPRAVPSVQAVSQQVTCATTTQKPYAPQINSVTASSGSALIAWTYQLLDQTDCEPDSWSVKVTALSTTHQPDNPIQTVNGQTQLMFAGLRPATTYEATVTAYINNQATTSPPVTFTTAARGPDAPTSVTTTSDGKGDWVVSWAPCTAANCYVTADTWKVTGQACGTSYVGQPPAVEVPGTQSSVTINADTLGLLGDSLTFTVQGSLASGLAGDPTADHSCSEAWRAPDPSTIALNRSAAQKGQTVTVTLQVAPSVPPVEAFGSLSTEFVYSVGGVTVGPTPDTSATIPGLAPGVAYTPSVVIYPAGHQDAAITVTGQPLTPTLQWPTGMTLSVDPAVGQDPNQGTVALTFANVPPGPMQARGAYTCGSTQGPQFSGPLSSSGALQVAMNLIDFGGACSITATISDSDPAPYGGTSSGPIKAGFTIGTQPHYTFSAQVDPGCQKSLCAPQVIDVLYTGTTSEPASGGGNWEVRTQSSGSGVQGGADPCATQAQLADTNPFPAKVSLPDLCLDPRKVNVTVLYKYLGIVTSVDAGSPSGSSPPPPTTSTTAPAAAAAARPGNGLSAMIVPMVLPLVGLTRQRLKSRRLKSQR